MIVPLSAETLAAVGRVEDLTPGRTDDATDARAVLGTLAAAGVDHGVLVAALERDSIRRVMASWSDAVAVVESTRSDPTLKPLARRRT
jgi:hypothetical protein